MIKKAPFHCWLLETKQEKEQAEKDIEMMNEELEPIFRKEWELQTGIRRLSLAPIPGRKPQWR